MKVRDIMNAGAPTVEPDASVAEVTSTMLDLNLPGLPVVDRSGRVLGIVTETDLVHKHARLHLPRYIGILGGVVPLDMHRTDEDMRRIVGVKAQEIMTTEVIQIAPDDDVDDAATLMVERGANPLIVIENGRVVGVLSRTDILRLLVIEERDVDGLE
jgi:CBS domain-containing protein